MLIAIDDKQSKQNKKKILKDHSVALISSVYRTNIPG